MRVRSTGRWAIRAGLCSWRPAPAWHHVDSSLAVRLHTAQRMESQARAEELREGVQQDNGVAASPPAGRVRRRRHRMTRSGQAERLQREIAARMGVESAECVRSRTASATALQRRARARLSVAVALLLPPDRCGWGLPEAVVARILDFLPVAGDATAMREAAAAGDVARVRKHLDLGVDPNAADSGVTGGGIAGATALHWAASGGHPATVIVLLNAKADPRLPCAGLSGATALHLAAQSSRIKLLEPPTRNNGHGGTQQYGTPQHSAEAKRGDWRRRQVIEALLLAGADPSLTTMGAGSLRRAQRRLCICFALATWSHGMVALLENRRSGRCGYAQQMSGRSNWFHAVIEKIVSHLPLREQTPGDKALEFHESTGIFSRWEWATATATSFSSSSRNELTTTKAKQHSQMPTLDVALLVEKNAYTASIYQSYSDATAEDEKQRILRKANSRLQEIYHNEYRKKEAIRERFRRAVRPHLPPPHNRLQELMESGSSVQNRSHVWLQIHGKLLVHTQSYPGLDELQKWATKNRVSNNDRLNLLESCCTRDPWNAGQQLVSMLDSMTKEQLRAFLDALPRTAVMLSGGVLGFCTNDRMVVTAVSKRSTIDAAGVRPGMRLLRIGRAPVGDITSFEQLQTTVSMIDLPCLFRFSATAGMSFTSMEEQVFDICEILHEQRTSHITRSAAETVKSGQWTGLHTAMQDDDSASRARTQWQRVAWPLKHTRSAPLSLKALASGDRNSTVILAMHYARLRDERRGKLRARPRDQHRLQDQRRTQEECDRRQQLEDTVNEAFDVLTPEVDKQVAKQTCDSLGLASAEDYVDGLFGAYGVDTLPRETLKRCVVKRCLG